VCEQACGRLCLCQRRSGVRVDLRAGLAARDRSLLLELPVQLDSPLVFALGQPVRMLQQLPKCVLEAANPRLQNLRPRI
jgi:hypothetical protein